MNTTASPTDLTHEPRLPRKTILWAAGVFILLLLSGIFWVAVNQNGDSLRGTLTIDAPPGSHIYVGDKLVGDTSVTLRWQDLLAGDRDYGILPLAPGEIGPQAAQAVAEPGATILWTQISMTASTGSFGFEAHTMFLRRQDGTLDVVQLLICQVSDRETRRFLVPVRVRASESASTAARFPVWAGGGISGGINFGTRPRPRVTQGVIFVKPPAEFEQEITERGLWRPPDEGHQGR